jgi:hypothetical protein
MGRKSRNEREKEFDENSEERTQNDIKRRLPS